MSSASILFIGVKKMFSCYNAALFVMALPGGWTLASLSEAILKDTPVKELMMPLLVAIFCIGFYVIWFLFDFGTGLYASNKLKTEKRWFKSDKAWSSLFKMASIIVIVMMFTCFSLISLLLKWEWVSTMFMITAGTFGIMASLYDFISIGENIEKVDGKKPMVFEFAASVAKAIDEGFTSKIKNFFTNESK